MSKAGGETLRKHKQQGTAATADGYEPVLEIRIPGTTTVESSGAELKTTFTPSQTSGFDVRLFGPNPNSEPYISRDAFENDTHLQQILATSYGNRQVELPKVGGAQRLVMDPDSDLYREHQFVQQFPDDRQQIAQVLLRYLLIYHELGTPDASGGHFMTLIDPNNALIGSLLPWSDIHHALTKGNTVPRAFPARYCEVFAFLQERESINRLRTAKSPYLELLSTVPMHHADREILKTIPQDRIDEILRDLEADYVRGDPTVNGRHQGVVETANWLEQTVGLDTALELLEVPRRATMNADKWLCDLINDLQAGIPPSDIPTHSGYWDTRPPVDKDHDYEEVKKRTRHQRQRFVEHPSRRARFSTYEVISVRDDELIRTWYSFRPTREFSLEYIRYCLFLQELFHGVDTQRVNVNGCDWKLSILNTSSATQPAMYAQPEDDITRPFYQALYQQARVDPFQAAMAGNLDTQTIGSYFEYESNTTLSHYAWQIGACRAATALGFTDVDVLMDWMEPNPQAN